MLWMKAWLETRWRLLYGLAIPLVALSLPFIAGNGAPSIKDSHMYVGVLAFFAVFNAAYLGGAGIRTQSPFVAMKGLQGSVYYTLSLPVTRFRLVSTRALAGFLEFAAVTAVAHAALWFLFPLARGNSTLVDLAALILASTACISSIYFFSVLLATFLDDPWQTFGGIFAAAFLWFVMYRLSAPPVINLFAFAGSASPLLTHVLPWQAMALSVALSAVLLFAAVKVAEQREY
jgi:hypothetical protein